MRVKGYDMSERDLAAMRRALQHELDNPRGHTWYNHVAVRAVIYEGFPDIKRDFWNIPCCTASVVIREERCAGRIEHIGGGKWRRVQPTSATVAADRGGRDGSS